MTGSYLSGEDFTVQLNAIAEVRFSDHQFGVSDLSREMGFSRNTLHRRMKQAFNCSASHYIRIKRLEKAHQLLNNRKFTIKRIAFLCGFQSATYFDKCFHDHYGYSPGEVGKK